MKSLIQILNEAQSFTITITKEVNPSIKIITTINQQTNTIIKIDNKYNVSFPFHKGEHVTTYQIQNFADVNGYNFGDSHGL